MRGRKADNIDSFIGALRQFTFENVVRVIRAADPMVEEVEAWTEPMEPGTVGIRLTYKRRVVRVMRRLPRAITALEEIRPVCVLIKTHSVRKWWQL